MPNAAAVVDLHSLRPPALGGVRAVGLSHRTAGVDVRERLAFDAAKEVLAVELLRRRGDLSAELVVLSTCNRVELYAASSAGRAAPTRGDLVALLCDVHALAPDRFDAGVYDRAGPDAAAHLFRVAAGLDSMVAGEAQILGQVRGAYDRASARGSAGAALHPLFQRALAVGKEVQSTCGLADGQLSVAAVAASRARALFGGTLAGRRVLSVGAGKMATLVLRALARAGATEFCVVSRDEAKARALAGPFGGAGCDFTALSARLADADVVVASTASSQPILDRAQFERACPGGRPVLVLDVALPRDVDARAGAVPGVTLLNLDDLQAEAARLEEGRAGALGRARSVVIEHVHDFLQAGAVRQLGPELKALYRDAHAVASEETAELLARLGPVSEAQKRAVEEHARRLVNKLLHGPVARLREAK